ncbi:MAG TPA: TetR/AcrR family transcriptional regulator [Streptosporangiaceae bacterium]|nr:TetR/AcrR family transcriptional regulator [Streptosporangiaceae bacterium]
MTRPWGRSTVGISDSRTQAERTAATREALLTAGRALFGERGYADVGTEEVVRKAGVSRGALYHHFADKAELFTAVLESVEEMVNARITAAMTTAGPDDPIGAMRLGTAAFLDFCVEPGMARIILIDGPAVLGAQAWSEASNNEIAATVQLINHGIELGRIPPQPAEPLARILLGALNQAALYIAAAADPAAARDEVGAALNGIIESVATSGRT